MEKRELTARELRHKRKVKNQILVYITSIVVLLFVVVGIYSGVKYIIKSINNYNQKVELAMKEADDATNQVQEETASVAATNEQIDEPEVPTVDPLDELVDALINEMTIEEKIAGLFMLTPEKLTGVNLVVQAKDGTKNALEAKPIGGLLYSDKNYKSADQFMQMITNTRGFSKYPLFIAVQRETGKEKTFGLEETTKASEITSTDAVKENYAVIADRIMGFGINMNFAPVADVVSEEGYKNLQGRTFGSDATTAAPLVTAAVSTLQDRGISAVLQTFPGEGGRDSSGVITKSLEEYNNSEFIVYRMAIENGVECITVSNAVAEELTGDDMPVIFSRKVINDVLRTDLGFNGVVMTSRMDEKIITDKFSSKDAAVLAIMAGADMIVCPADYDAAYQGIMDAITSGMITTDRIEQSLHRIYRIKYKNVDFNS